MTLDFASSSVADIVREISEGRVSASECMRAALGRIAALNPRVNAFTDILESRAIAAAARIDRRRLRGERLGPLAGVPFGVKNLIDIAGLPTRAGSKINRQRTAAVRDAALVRRLERAGAILVGGLNMGEYAYDFTGENPHDGACRNPHDLDRMAGGSSSGSGAAVAAGFLPLALGSDTNGSIRVPSAFCGVFGLKPTYGRLTRAGSFPFVSSLDHLGPFARTARDLALAYDAMQGPDANDPVATTRRRELTSSRLDMGVEGLRTALARGYFGSGAHPEALEVVEQAGRALGTSVEVEIPEAARARAAAQIITAAEAAALHLDRLRERSRDFDPVVRDRLLAGSAVPAAWVDAAQRFRRHYHHAVLQLFETVDIIIAPTTPFVAPRIGQRQVSVDGKAVDLRPAIGRFTQPLSFIGLPVVAVPIWTGGSMPLSVQVIAAPWREDAALRVAHRLEAVGFARAPVATLRRG